MLKRITPRNFLSFGPDNPGIELGPLNVLIGPNGCGKSNLIEAVGFMRAAPKELRDVTRKGGGTQEWIWKGNPDQSASVEWVVNQLYGSDDIRHALHFRSVAHSFSLVEERIETAGTPPFEPQNDSLYLFRDGRSELRTVGPPQPPPSPWKPIIEPDRSILAQLYDHAAYPELAWLNHTYDKVRIYREWTFGRNTVFREPQRADDFSKVLEEDFSNLGLFLNRLKARFPAAKRSILEKLQDLYAGITEFEVLVDGGTVQVRLIEKGDFSIPATRLSDGTLRYLCLLAILCDPEPPPLICIEEPELGLHPDMLPNLADLLLEAATRTQLIVTTHSDILVDSMTETPEAVIVCSKEDGQTRMERLSRETLSHWLDKYRLGQLWMQGELGGTRW